MFNHKPRVHSLFVWAAGDVVYLLPCYLTTRKHESAPTATRPNVLKVTH